MNLFRRRDDSQDIETLYDRLVDLSRDVAFYTELGVPDTIDGRFDMLSIHVHATLRRLKGQGAEADRGAQALFDRFMLDMDQSLREMGVGDLGVGKRIKKMGAAFYGRMDAYDRALDAGSDEAVLASMIDMLRRNLYRGAGCVEEAAEGCARRVLAFHADLAERPTGDILLGRV